MIRLCSQKNTWLFNKLKHGGDALISLVIFLLQLPLFLAISLAVKFDSSGPVFYKSQALGKNGKLFQMYKFRSMVVDAENQRNHHEDQYRQIVLEHDSWSSSAAGFAPRGVLGGTDNRNVPQAGIRVLAVRK